MAFFAAVDYRKKELDEFIWLTTQDFSDYLKRTRVFLNAEWPPQEVTDAMRLLTRLGNGKSKRIAIDDFVFETFEEEA